MKKIIKIILILLFIVGGMYIFLNSFISYAFNKGWDAGYEFGLNKSSENYFPESKLFYLENCIYYMCIQDKEGYCEGTLEINNKLLNGEIYSQEEYLKKVIRRYVYVDICAVVLFNGTKEDSFNVEEYLDSLGDEEFKTFSNLPEK